MVNVNPLLSIRQRCRSAFIFIGIISCILNLLMLTIPIYTLQIFDRVIISQSADTLIYLSIIAILALLVLALLDIVRSRVFLQVGLWLDRELNPEVLDRSISQYLAGNSYVTQSLTDIALLRQFLSSSATASFFDIPWVFIYLIVIFILSITLGVVATLGAALLFFLALLNENATKKPTQEAEQAHIHNQRFFSDLLKNAESIFAMGMIPTIKKKWLANNENALNMQKLSNDSSSVLLSTSKFARMILQLAVLGIGAYLVLLGNFTGGSMMAASIIAARALAPVESAISSWKQFLQAQAAYRHLKTYLDSPAERTQKIQLEKPKGILQVSHLTFVPLQEKHPVIFNINFTLSAGESLAIVGPSSAGKSTLLRLLLGMWQPTEGEVRVDGSNIHDWSAEQLGQYIGYLPQTSELFMGTVKENIARLDIQDEKEVIAAAEFVNAHHMILNLKASYDTPADRYTLSGGQQQRIALARAFYKKPSFVFLDEPEKNLDQDGLIQLKALIEKAKAEKITLIYATHQIDLARIADKTLILHAGQMQAFGAGTQVLQNRTT